MNSLAQRTTYHSVLPLLKLFLHMSKSRGKRKAPVKAHIIANLKPTYSQSYHVTPIH